MSDVSGYLVVSAKALCHNITCELIQGSPPPFYFFIWARGEPEDEATLFTAFNFLLGSSEEWGRPGFIHHVNDAR